jgi:hypothetical protein
MSAASRITNRGQAGRSATTRSDCEEPSRERRLFPSRGLFILHFALCILHFRIISLGRNR